MDTHKSNGLFRSTSVPVVTICALSMCSLSFGCLAKYQATRTTTVTHRSGMGLKASTDNGRIEVRPCTGDTTTIKATFAAATPERLEGVTVKAELDPEGTLVVRPVWPGAGRQPNEACSLVIATPRIARLDLASRNGRLDVSGLSGPARLQTRNGRVTVGNHQGPLEVEVANGSITIQAVEGALQARSRNGSIKVGKTGSTVDLETCNGSIAVKGGTALTGRLEISTANGSIRTGLGRRGRVISRRDRQVMVQVGEGSQLSRIRTRNGSVTLTLADRD